MRRDNASTNRVPTGTKLHLRALSEAPLYRREIPSIRIHKRLFWV